MYDLKRFSLHGRHTDIVPFMKLIETFVETLRVTSCTAKHTSENFAFEIVWYKVVGFIYVFF